jgi:tetratricopeptide (TPR) repeat protein
MSRIYLIIGFIAVAFTSLGQTELKQLLRYASEQYEKGDFYSAKDYYERALSFDSNSVSILWNYAETLRAYQDYEHAAKYYAKVYAKEEARLYPMSLLNWGLMLKQTGDYTNALTVFKLAKKVYSKDKKGYAYLKSRQEVAACIWAVDAQKDSSFVTISALSTNVNSKNAEFGHLIHDNKLIFSSLRADSISAQEEVYGQNYHTHIFRAEKNGKEFKESERLDDLFYENLNTGNGTFSLDGKRFYFSLCEKNAATYRCKIMVAKYENGRWSAIDSLGHIINQPETTTTQPSIGKVNNEEWLFFSSNRSDAVGGMDIYYSVIQNGNQFSNVKNLKEINTIGDEVTPFFDSEKQLLYFSSNFHQGLGGFDVFQSSYEQTAFREPTNLGVPVNSPANDLYYFTDSDTAYVSSNRVGSLFSKNPTCCSDIYVIHPKVHEVLTVPELKEETLAELNARLPVTLYFHNDIPNPNSWEKSTNINYIDTYNDYTKMLQTYQKEYAKGLTGDKARDANEDIEDFFIEFVDKGVSDLKHFQTLLLAELDKGARIVIQVKGFASPLAKTDYNVNLTKRRIASLVNYLRAYNEGVFSQYMDNKSTIGGKLEFVEVPFGEYNADQLISDNPNDTKNSVYSRAAALERKIEIQSVTYIEDDSLAFALRVDNPIVDLGSLLLNEEIQVEFVITNTASDIIILNNIMTTSSSITIPEYKTEITPNENYILKVNFNAEKLGHSVHTILINTEQGQELELSISLEAKE